jgi:hypothetical protein
MRNPPPSNSGAPIKLERSGGSGRNRRVATSPAFYFRVAGIRRGPATVEQLRDLAGVYVITPETEITANAGEPWVAIKLTPIYLAVFPPRPVIEFKASEFESLNPASAPVITVDGIKEAALKSPSSLRGREVLVSPKVVRPARDGDPANDVQAMVLEVGRRVAASTPEVVLPPPPRSFRWVWFAVPSVLGTTGILCIPLLYDGKVDAISFSILGGWVVLFNGLLAALLAVDRQLDDRVRRNRAKLEQLK